MSNKKISPSSPHKQSLSLQRSPACSESNGGGVDFESYAESYNDWHNYYPSAQEWNSLSEEERRQKWKALDNFIDAEKSYQELEERRAYDDLEKLISKTMREQKIDRSTAIRWLAQAQGYECSHSAEVAKLLGGQFLREHDIFGGPKYDQYLEEIKAILQGKNPRSQRK